MSRLVKPAHLPQRLNGEAVLILDDDTSVRHLFVRLVHSIGAETFPAATIDEAKAIVGARSVAVAIIDKNLGSESGLDFLKWLKATQPDCEALVITAYGNMESAIEALRLGASDFLLKPAEVEILTHRVSLLVERRRMLAERNGLQAQLMQTDRMAALGMLAAGVVHEINNPLTYVLSNLEYLEDQPELSTEVKQIIGETRHGARQMASVVNHIKTFAHHGEAVRTRTDVTSLVEGTLKMSAVLIRQRAQLTREMGPIPDVEGLEFQLAQVFLNLLVNASQAIPEGAASKNEVKVRLSTNAAGEAVVEVTDTGAGMAPEVLRKMFQPFFTTKPRGVGTGIGLTICKNIVESHGGRIEIESTVGRGSTFRVVLPAMRAETPAAELAPLSRDRATARGRVLVIDDDVAVAASIQRCLGREHSVVVEHGGAAALVRFRKGETFDAIISDVMMPDVTGHQLFEMLEKGIPRSGRPRGVHHRGRVVRRRGAAAGTGGRPNHREADRRAGLAAAGSIAGSLKKASAADAPHAHADRAVAGDQVDPIDTREAQRGAVENLRVDGGGAEPISTDAFTPRTSSDAAADAGEIGARRRRGDGRLEQLHSRRIVEADEQPALGCSEQADGGVAWRIELGELGVAGRIGSDQRPFRRSTELITAWRTGPQLRAGGGVSRGVQLALVRHQRGECAVGRQQLGHFGCRL